MSLTIHEAYDLLYSHPRETCPHCQRPVHAQKCAPQIAYEKHASWERPFTTPLAERDPDIDAARAIEAREDARREYDDYEGE